MPRRRISPWLVVAALVSLLLPSLALGAEPPNEPVNMNPGEIKWTAAPPSLPVGAKAAVLNGDPGKPGAFILRLSMPAGYRVPPHWHSRDENVTVIQGTLNLGVGDALDKTKAHAVKTGGFHHIPATVHHYAFAEVPTIVQINGEGPFDISYINPDDDPRKDAGSRTAHSSAK